MGNSTLKISTDMAKKVLHKEYLYYQGISERLLKTSIPGDVFFLQYRRFSVVCRLDAVDLLVSPGFAQLLCLI